jgi:hypothetical protein
MLTELVCSSRLDGRRVHPGVTFIAAVNPYRLRAVQVHGVGLQHAAATVDPLSRLVYRVHPLPETMLTSVWDFGALSGEAEGRYLSSMMATPPAFLAPVHAQLAIACVAASHAFLAVHEAECCTVSLRDPQRFRRLAAWFREKLTLREMVRRAEAAHRRAAQRNSFFSGSWLGGITSNLLRFGADALGATSAMFSFGGGGGQTREVELSDAEIELRAIVLACAHCYRARLSTTAMRAEYLTELARVVRAFSRGEHYTWWQRQHRDTWASYDVTPGNLREVILSEQMDYLSRMKLPSGTAPNEALRENVFTLLVCILNRVPVFLVGKPGCSKSLAMQLIDANLRGADSRDDFFRALPQVYLLSFQGSFDSTSEGVRAVFDKATRYAATNPADEVIPVVLLDEVGLAEVSPHNPLKVLHALLETRDGAALPYAVVGISNWALDAAKINRAVLLSRPDPTLDDLYDTAVEIARGLDAAPHGNPRGLGRLRIVAQAYAAFQQARAGAPETRNFHGLRDFYALCKCMARMEAPTDAAVIQVIHRCFGGSPGSAAQFERTVRGFHGLGPALEDAPSPRVTELVRANLTDPFARHLLLVTRGDAALGVLRACFPATLRPPVVLIGSSFEDDLRPSYTYEVLSKIILYMETGQPICLYRHERVYGSLYDMLNQSYALVGDKRLCRMALGASANPTCNVHPDFRCVVVVDEDRVRTTDPPFLNRFEKHVVNCVDALPPRLAALLPRLAAWVTAAAAIHATPSGARLLDFGLEDAFGGFGLRSGPSQDEPLAALLLQQAQTGATDAMVDEELLTLVKAQLLATSSVDAVLRLSHSALCQAGGAVEVAALQDAYFGAAEHASLAAAIEQRVLLPTAERPGVSPPRLLVLTHAAFSAVKDCFADSAAGLVVVLQLGSFGCEAKLSEALSAFWRKLGACTLVVQAAASHDAAHIALCKHLMEWHEREYVEQAQRARAVERREYARNESLERRDGAGAADGQQLRAARSAGSATALKHQVMVIHLRRGTAAHEHTPAWHFSGLSDWQQVAVDAVAGTAADAADLQVARTTPLAKWITAGAGEDGLAGMARAELPWCFRQLSYAQTEPDAAVEHARGAAQLLCSAEAAELLQELCNAALVAMQAGAFNAEWLSALACTRHALLTDATMVAAMRRAARSRLRAPLLQLVHKLEENGALSTLRAALAPGQEARLRLWRCVHMQSEALRLAAAAAALASLQVPRLARLMWPPSPLIMAAAKELRGAYVDAEGCWLARRASTRNLPAQLLAQLDSKPAKLRVLLQCADALDEAEVTAALQTLQLDGDDDGGKHVAPRQAEEQQDDGDDGAAELSSSAASDKLSALLLAYRHEYVTDVLSCEADALAARHAHLQAPRVAELLRRALPPTLPHPLDVHLELWRAQRVLDTIIELEQLSGCTEDAPTRARAPAASARSIADFGLACLVAACGALVAQLAGMAGGEGEELRDWLRAAGRAKLLGSKLMFELGEAAPPAPPELRRLRMVTDVASCLFSSLQDDARAACDAACALAADADTDDGAAFFELAAQVLARFKARASPQLARQIDSCCASIALRLLEQDDTDAGTPAFSAVLRVASGASWEWGHANGTPDDVAGPPLLATIVTQMLWVVAGGDTSVCLADGGDVPAELSQLLAASLEDGTPFAVLVCDRLQRQATAWLAERIDDGAEAAARFQRAVTVVLLDATDATAARESPLQLLASVALVKAYLAAAAVALAPDGARACVLTEALVSALPVGDAGVADDATPARALKAFLLRELQHAGGMSAQGCARAAGSEDGRLARLLPCLFRLPWPVPAETMLGFCPFIPGRPRLPALRAAMQQLMRTREPPAELRDAPLPADVLLAAASVTLLAAQPPSAQQRATLGTWCTTTLGAGQLGRLAALACQVPATGCRPGAMLPLACAQPEDAPILNSAMLHLVAACRAGPLRDYMAAHGPAGVHTTDFVLAGQGRGNTFSQMQECLLAGPFVRYQCQCGLQYPVGNCGFTNETFTCSCGRDIGNARGAATHTMVATSTRLDANHINSLAELEALYPELPGYATFSGDARITQLTERALPPVVFRLLHLLVHLALAAAALEGDVVGVAPADARAGAGALLWATAQDDWAVLAALLPGCTRDALGMLLHRVIATCVPSRPGRLRDAAARVAWEAAFAAAVAPLLADVPATCVECARLYAGDVLPSALEQQLAEHGAGHAASWRPALMRCIQQPSFAELQAQLGARDVEMEQAHPLLHYALKPIKQALLRQAALLPPLVRWARIAFDALDHRITRAQSLERDVAWLLTQLADDGARAAYADFVRAWEALRAEHAHQRFECEELVLDELSGENGHGVLLALFCLAPAGAGAVLLAALSYVASVHNTLVQEVALLAPRCAALQFRCRATGLAQVRSARLLELQPADMLCYDADAEQRLASYSRPRLGAGPGVGRVVLYDHAAMEGELAALLGGAALAESGGGAVTALRFQGEGLHANATLLSDLRDRVPQDAALPGADALARALRAAAASSGSSAETFSLLAALESLGFYLARAGGAPADPLLEFADSWLAAEEREALLRVPSARMLRLEHFEALFMVVEDAVADELVTPATVDPRFMTDVPADVMDALRALCAVPAPGATPAAAQAAAARAAALADALKRFLSRHLAGEASFSEASAQHALADYFSMLSWQPAARHLVSEFEDGLPRELLLAHAYSAWSRLKQLATIIAAARPAQPPAQPPTQQRKRPAVRMN